MLGVGGTPFALIRKYLRRNGFVAGANAGNAKAGMAPNVTIPFFSMSLPFVNYLQNSFKLYLTAFNDGGSAPGYAACFNEWLCLYGSTPVNLSQATATKIGENLFSINPGSLTIISNVSLQFAANVLTVALQPTMTGPGVAGSSARIDAYIELFAPNPLDTITIL